MNQLNQQQLAHMMERYTALWNEPDATRRRQLIAELWVEDGIQCTTQHEYRGYPALEERVASAYEAFIVKGGFRFQLSSAPKHHHQAITCTWEMVPAGGSEAAAVATFFLLLSEDGRICEDYQF